MSFSETAAAIYLRIADKLGALRKDEKGVTAIEYGLIAGFISIAIIAGATLAGTSLTTIFNTIGSELQNAAGAASG